MTATQPTFEHRQRRALLCDADRQHARSVLPVLRVIASRVDKVERVDEVPEGDTFDVVIINDDAFSEGERARALQRFSVERDRGRLIMCSSLRKPEALAVLFGELGLTNVLGQSQDAGPPALLVTAQKMLQGDIFGMEKYFSWGVPLRCFSLQDGSARDDVRESAREFAATIGAQSRMINSYCTVVDELTTNALYNAPVTDSGEARFAHLKRSEPVSLELAERAEITLCSDGRVLGCSVVDPFGSLDPRTVVDYLGRCFRRGDDQISTRTGGAGLGLFTVYELCSHVVINIAAGRRTEIIGLIDIASRYRDFAGRAKSFNIFMAS